MSEPPARDYFDRARLVAATLLFIAAVTAVAGSLLDWVTIDPPPNVPPSQADKVDPFNGFEARDGWIVTGAALILGVNAVLIVIRPRNPYLWTAFIASILIGAIAIADYRGVGDLDSAITRRTDRAGELDPALGLVLVAIAGFLGLIGSAGAVAATPRR